MNSGGGGQQEEQKQGTGEAQGLAHPPALPSTGKRAYSGLRRALDEDDLGQSGVQKLLLDAVDRAEEENERLRGFESRFHDVDKEAAVLSQRVRAQDAFEVLFVAGTTIGGVLAGLAPSLWDKQPSGDIVLAIGSLLIVLSTVARMRR